MKRRIRSFFAFVLIAALSVPVFSQADWVQKEIQWKLSGVTGDGASIYVRDTLKAVLGGGTTTLDTTGWFSLKDAQPLPRGTVAQGLTEVNGIPTAMYAYQSDTTVTAWLVFQADSTAAPTATLTSITVLLDGRVGGYGPATALSRGWVKIDSTVVDGGANRGNLTLADESVAIPIRTIGVYGNVFRWSQLRARTTAATGILSGCRAFIRYWQPKSTSAASEY